MIIEQLDPTGVVVETLDLRECFTNLRDVYQRYRIITSDGTYMLTPETCYQMGIILNDDDRAHLGTLIKKQTPFKFR